ncbi:MAG: magnesium/cobalt transporter CorA [Candidatus Omnitrophica bacterium]|jgi:magnesium transporter|nr:magnesium/cobalt transporter CorA [Candidatus Omnitrophota bacterium]
MSKFIKKASKTIGQAPGSIIYVGEKKIEEPRISIIDYDEKSFQEKEVKNVEECFPFKESPTITWINIDGLHDTDIISKIGNYFGIHHLILEDIANTSQRPKFEESGKYIFVVLNMLYFDEKDNETKAEQVSFVFGTNFVISFQEQEGDVFNPIRGRIRDNKGRIRKSGADYLAYVLVDAVVDNYFIILEKLGEKIANMEDELVANPSARKLQTIQDLKRDIIFLRKSVWPLREIISGLQRTESDLLQDSTAAYLRDLYDHTIQVIDTIESLRDMVSGMLDIYMSSISNKMNEVMKVLTIIATIFIPLTFIAGIYGMNFNPDVSFFNMPELNWKFGYMFAWGVMFSVASAMVIYFKKKRWF